MEEITVINLIVDKMKKGEHFGLFDDGEKCYFQDGTKVSYSNLWAALRLMYDLPAKNYKSITELCPETFEGTHNYKYSRHKWKKPNKPEKIGLFRFIYKLFATRNLTIIQP